MAGFLSEPQSTKSKGKVSHMVVYCSFMDMKASYVENSFEKDLILKQFFRVPKLALFAKALVR